MRLNDESGVPRDKMERDATPAVAGRREPAFRGYPFREYRFAATEATLDALRLLRGPWAGYAVTAGVLAVRLADGTGVRVGAEGTIFQGILEAFRVAAGPLDAGPVPPVRACPFAQGGNDVVLFQSEAWLEPTSTGRVTRRSGKPGARPESATAAAKMSDALLVASPRGAAVLVRCGDGVLDVTESREEIDGFLEERGYGG
ncbi:MAG: hypothetical protein ACJ79S_00070 [Gemmatimonadaceae bacterium]